jgi:hypothetical protein
MHWLIDGHNLIGQLPNLHLDDPHDEEKLLELLRSFRGRTGDSLTVVFDPGLAYHSSNTRKRGGLTVQFAPHGQTADQVIMRRLGKVKNPQGVTLVSSDQAVQQAGQRARVRVMSAQEFTQILLQPASPSEEADSRADIHLSADEVEEWLDFFNQRKS